MLLANVRIRSLLLRYLQLYLLPTHSGASLCNTASVMRSVLTSRAHFNDATVFAW